MGSGHERLAVPLSELEGFGSRLRSIQSRMNGTHKLLDSYREDIGDGGVCERLDEFESNWEDGREDISQSFDALADMSDAVVREFKKLDDDLAKKAQDAVKPEDKAGDGKGGGADGK